MPSPDKILGYPIGTPKKLTYTKDQYRYYRELEKATQRVKTFLAPEKSEQGRDQMLIVVSDDLALPFGAIRLRPKGTHGGQNGLRSIIDRLGTMEFIRLRIGIAPEHPISNASNFVLERFSKTETTKVEDILKISADALRAVIRDGVEKAMAEFN